MANCPIGKEASTFVSAIIRMSLFSKTISLSALNFFKIEFIFKYPTITPPIFLNLDKCNEDFASMSLS